MPREAALVRRAGTLLDARGAWWFKTHGSVMGRAGLPDIVACVRGRMLCVETKAPGGRLRPLQRYMLARAERAGAVVVVADELAPIAAAIAEIEAGA